MKKFPLRFTEDSLHEAIAKSAQNNRRSLNSEILRAIDFYLKQAPNSHYEVKPAKEVVKKNPKSP